MISRVHIENVRVIKRVETSLEQFTVLVGPNGAGKSTFMDVLGGMLMQSSAAVREPSGQYYQQASRHLPPQFGGWIEFQPTNSKRKFRFTLSTSVNSHNHPNTVHQWMVSSDNVSYVKYNNDNAIDPPSELTDAPRYVLPLRINTELLKDPAPKTTSLKHFSSNGAGLAAYIASLKLEDDEQFSFFKTAVCSIIPSISNIAVDSVSDPQNYRLEIVTQGGERVSATYISDGTLYTIAILAALSWTRGRPGIVFIDDLDHGLHPRGQKVLIDQLRQLLSRYPHIQIVATAQSPYLLDHFNPQEVRCLHSDGKTGTKIAKLTDHEDFEKWKDEMLSGEFWSAVGEQWVTKTAHE